MKLPVWLDALTDPEVSAALDRYEATAAREKRQRKARKRVKRKARKAAVASVCISANKAIRNTINKY